MILGFGIPSGGEWIIVLVIVVIFFGVGKLPAVLGQMGKGVKAFKNGMNEDDSDTTKLKELETEVEMAEAEEVKGRTTTAS
ncbi:MAG: twin-arginine translocase TatA/TatE family subunit [Myxococcota bacterium]|nr:twin-arginine translocase TatA/TatE family subunit [Myxococcota bacterium]